MRDLDPRTQPSVAPDASQSSSNPGILWHAISPQKALQKSSQGRVRLGIFGAGVSGLWALSLENLQREVRTPRVRQTTLYKFGGCCPASFGRKDNIADSVA